jgi:hypothetical protein
MPVFLMLVLATFNAPINAEATCKGLIESNCLSNTSCLWVNGYVTKKGTEVNGYCRVKSSKQSVSNKLKTGEQTKQSNLEG